MNLLTFIMLMAFLVIGGLLGVYVMLMQKRTHRFVCKRKGKDHSSTKIYWMKEVTEKDGVTWWQSWPFPDVKVLGPPGKAIDHLPHGKFIATGFLLGKDEVIWTEVSLKEGDKVAVEEGVGQALGPAQKSALINQIKKAEAERMTKPSLQTLILNIGPTLILGIVLILAIISITDIAGAINSIQDKTANIADKLIETGRLCEQGKLGNPQVVAAQTGTTVIPSTQEKPPTP